ncbi:MAG: glycosyltransferase family 2 protein [Ignavibacteriales bacterium]|nr:glycosyltransferase family 2 protein [Ignavibacteriales bacterium]
MSSNSLVSVIIPTFNSSKYILETIRSVEEQSHQNYEIIIVDDESTDNTETLVKLRQKINDKIKFYKIKHAGRPSVPRNFGIHKSNGEFIAFLDSDDLWERNKLKEQLIVFKTNPELFFVYSTSITIGNIGFLSSDYELLPLFWKAAKTHQELINKGNSIPLSSVLAKKEVLIKLNGFDEDPEMQIEDYDLWLRMSKLGLFEYIPRIHVFYRVHSSQYSASWEIKKARLNYLKIKRNLSLPDYRFSRNKSIIMRITRNSIHFLNYSVLVLATFITRKLKSE